MIVFDAIEPLFKKDESLISAKDITYHLKFILFLNKEFNLLLHQFPPDLGGARGVYLF